MTQKEFVEKYSGNACPSCKSLDATPVGAVIEGLGGATAVRCDDCGATWEVLTEVTGFRNLKVPDAQSDEEKHEHVFVVDPETGVTPSEGKPGYVDIRGVCSCGKEVLAGGCYPESYSGTELAPLDEGYDFIRIPVTIDATEDDE